MTGPVLGRPWTILVALTLPLTVACEARSDPSDPPPASPAPASTAAEEPTLAEAVGAVEERVGLYDGIATGVIALVRVGEDSDVVVAGRADVDRGIDMAEDQTWPVASITKMMTATVVMQLVEEGRLDLADPARLWLPEIRGVAPTITIEHLLSHRSGLRDSTDADIRRVGFGSHDLLVAAAGHPLDFEPGTRGSYDNLGYAALGLVIERVLDQPLGQVLEERIFRPAGMSRSALFGHPQVHGYVDGEDWSGRYFLRLQPAAGSVVSTVGDVDAFLQALWAGRLVEKDVLADMRSARGPVGNWSDYGLGLGQETFTCGQAWGHGGRLNGFSSEAWTLESGSNSAVVVVNDDLSEAVRSFAEAALCGG